MMPRNKRKRKSDETYCLLVGEDRALMAQGSESAMKRRKAEYEAFTSEPTRIVKKRQREDEEEERLRKQTKRMRLIEEQDNAASQALIIDRRRDAQKDWKTFGMSAEHRAAAYDILLHRNTCSADLQNRYRTIVSQL